MYLPDSIVHNPAVTGIWSSENWTEPSISFSNGQPPCPHCSGNNTFVFHQGKCPEVKAIEYHPNGQIKKIEYR